MISLRYHAISIGAVFLALAVGVVLGASGVSERLLGAITTERDDLSGHVQQLTSERDTLAASQRASDEFAQRIGPAAVHGLLQGKTVAIVTAAGADPADDTAITALLGQAGATVTGEVALTDAVGDPARADQLRQLAVQLLPAGAKLPAASDTGSLTGGLLGGVLLGPSADAAQAKAVLGGLAGAGFVKPGPVPPRSDMVVVLTGGALTGVDAGDAAAVIARLSAELDRSGSGAVLAGRAGSADGTGAVGVARADSSITADLSTVDDVESGSGKVSTVLALSEQAAGRSGRYGTAVTAADGSAPRA